MADAVDVSLLSEAQWEVAARITASFANDNSTADFENWNCFDNGGFSSETLAVGSFDANGYNLFDMNGNVTEFCLDQLDTVTTGATDPVGTTSGTIAVRGGGWLNKKENCTVDSRVSSGTTTSNAVTGFRLVFTNPN